jgi:hypothetical protein
MASPQAIWKARVREVLVAPGTTLAVVIGTVVIAFLNFD